MNIKQRIENDNKLDAADIIWSLLKSKIETNALFQVSTVNSLQNKTYYTDIHHYILALFHKYGVCLMCSAQKRSKEASRHKKSRLTRICIQEWYIYHLCTSQLFEDINTWQETAAFEFSYKNNEQQRRNTKNEQAHKIINNSLKLQPNGNVHAQCYDTSPTIYFQLWVKKE